MITALTDTSQFGSSHSSEQSKIVFIADYRHSNTHLFKVTISTWICLQLLEQISACTFCSGAHSNSDSVQTMQQIHKARANNPQTLQVMPGSQDLQETLHSTGARLFTGVELVQYNVSLNKFQTWSFTCNQQEIILYITNLKKKHSGPSKTLT